MSISQDILGRIWIGTRNGINIFNGKNIEAHKSFIKNDSTYFYVNNVKAIVKNSKGDMYIKSSYDCIKYDIRQDKFIILPISKVNAICGHNGRVYISQNGNIYKLNPLTDEPILIKSFSLGRIGKLLIDRNNNFWFSTNSGIYQWNRETNETVRKHELNNVYALYQSNDGDIWATSFTKGIVRWSGNKEVHWYLKENKNNKGLWVNSFRDIAEDRNGNIWFASMKGLYKYIKKDDCFKPYYPNKLYESLSDISIYPLFIDNDNNLWIGTFLGGVEAFPTLHNSLNFFDANKTRFGLSNRIVSDIVEDNDSLIWIGTEGGGLNCFNPKERTFKKFPTHKGKSTLRNKQYLPYNNIKSLAYDKHTNKLYIGTNLHGLFCYDLKSDKFNKMPFPSKKKSGTVNSMTLCNTHLVLSTNNSLYVYDTEKKTDSIFFSVHSNFYRYVQKIEKDVFWFLNNGVNELDMNHQTLTKTKISFPHTVYHFIKAKNGDVYFTSHGGGVYRWSCKTNTLETLNNKMKGIGKFCYKIVETKTGKLIITCDEGVCVINPNGEILRLYKLDKSIPLGAFTKDCGLFVASDSTIYIGSTNGLLTLKEEDLLKAPVSETLYFSDLYVQGKEVLPKDGSNIMSIAMPFAKSISLPYWHHRIDIHFSAKDNVLDNACSRYQYRLLGIDRDWNFTVGNVITYTNLPSGKYTLELRPYDEPLKHTKTRVLQITVLSPWYATWWAQLIWLTLIIILIIITVKILRVKHKANETIMLERMEKEKIKAINDARLQFFTNVSHEFKTPLTLIIGQIEQLLNCYKLPPILHNKLTKTMRYSRQLGDLITELMEYRKCNPEQLVLNIRRCSAKTFFTDICNDFKGLAQMYKLTFNYEFNAADVDIYIDKTQMTKVVSNLLSNAFKFTPEGGQVTCLVWMNDISLSFKVADTGQGIDTQDIDRIFDRFYQAEGKDKSNMEMPGTGIGLALVKDIVEQHKGRILVESKVNEGSEFVVTIPLGKEHFNGLIIESNDEEEEEMEDEEEYIIEDKSLTINDYDLKVQDTESLGVSKNKPTILIVEDNLETLNILKSLFDPLYKVATATNGEEGLAKIRQVNPDIVLTDWIMPNMSGAELCSKIKNEIELCHISVVLLTALNLPQQQMEGFIAGADDYISKPFNSKILLARCNNIIRSKRRIYQKLANQVQSELSFCATNSLDKEFLDKVTTYVEQNMGANDFSIDTLSTYVNMSRSLFYNKFKSLTGMTPNDFINNHRLKKAAIWLVQYKEKTINEISDELGFSTHNYFSTKFKEYYGISPMQYRKKNTQKNK